jgi:hypothetical protein
VAFAQGGPEGQAIESSNTCLTGKVVLKGLIPPAQLQPLANMKDSSLIISKKEQAIKNVVVIVRRIKNDASLTPSKPVAVFTDYSFSPRIIHANPNEWIEFKKDESVLFPIVIGLGIDSKFKQMLLDNTNIKWKAEAPTNVPIPIYASIPDHANNKAAYYTAGWLYTTNNFVSITSDDGSFEIKNLKPGQHQLMLWHERIGLVEKVILNKKVVEFNKCLYSIDIGKEGIDFGEIGIDINK